MKNPVIALSLIGTLVLFYQNCDQSMDFESIISTLEAQSLEDSLAADSVDGDIPLSPPPPAESVFEIPHGPVICDPFSDEKNCDDPSQARVGLKGFIYYLVPGTQSDVDRGRVDNYIKYGEKVATPIQLTHLEIPNRSWLEGFPGPDGPIRNTEGEELLEWFALDLRGFINLAAPLISGKYQFALATDDGSILDIDGEMLIDNDGTHALRWKCSDRAAELTQNQNIPVRLRYFQGPRQHIALMAYLRPWSEKHKPCDASGGWESLRGHLFN